MVVLNFCSVMKILIKYTNVSLTKCKTDFIYAIFSSFLESNICKNYVMDLSTASRWLNGKRDLS